MIDGHKEAAVAQDHKRQHSADRWARETRVGWPTLVAILVLIIAGTAIVAYLLIDRVGGS